MEDGEGTAESGVLDHTCDPGLVLRGADAASMNAGHTRDGDAVETEGYQACRRGRCLP